jgi:hypothetical protein
LEPALLLCLNFWTSSLSGQKWFHVQCTHGCLRMGRCRDAKQTSAVVVSSPKNRWKPGPRDQSTTGAEVVPMPSTLEQVEQVEQVVSKCRCKLCFLLLQGSVAMAPHADIRSMGYTSMYIARSRQEHKHMIERGFRRQNISKRNYVAH